MSAELIAIIAVGVALGSLTAGLILRIDRRIDRLETRLEARMDRLETRMDRLETRIDGYIAEAGNDRRAFQAAMDDFRREMQRLAERQSHVEGLRAAE